MPIVSLTDLYNACSDGDAATVRRLLPAGGTRLDMSREAFQASNFLKSTPLMVAAQYGRTEIVRIILDLAHNTAVDAADATGGTPLFQAAAHLHVGVIHVLAERGASLNVASLFGQTPLSVAAGQMLPGSPAPRDPDPDGARQIATVRALLRLGAGTLPSSSPTPDPPTTPAPRSP
jgi:hypothetical protein